MPSVSIAATLPRARQFLRSNAWISATVGLVAAYAAWMVVFRLFALTLLTWFLISGDRRPRFEEISEAFASNELPIIALGSVAFVAFLRRIYPLTPISSRHIITAQRIEKRFLPGFSSGAILASVMVAALLAGGLYKSLGSFIQLDEGSLAAGAVIVRIFSILALAYCEEFLFRWKVMGWLRVNRDNLLTDVAATCAAALAYCFIKLIQFDIGLMHLTTLFLLSVAASIRTLEDSDFGRSAGFVAGLLIVFHALLSLPILGNDFTGAILIKYQPPELTTTGMLDWELGRILTGGAGGPLASLFLQVLLILDIARGLIRHQKSALNRQPGQLHFR